MYREAVHFLLVVAIVLAASVAPLMRATLSCCTSQGQAGQATALVGESEPGPAGCGSCCASGLDTDTAGRPVDHSQTDHSDRSYPCGDDCGCTLCRVMTSASPAFVEEPAFASSARSADPVFADPDHVFTRDAAFGLLRPPQA
jgi:hypothetical protein